MDLLLYFALPVSTILLSIVWQKIVKSPILVAITAFAIFLIATYAVDPNLLIFAIVYTILAFITASLTRIISDLIGKNGMFKNITADNINTNTLNTNNLNVDDNSSCSSRCFNNRLMRRY